MNPTIVEMDVFMKIPFYSEILSNDKFTCIKKFVYTNLSNKYTNYIRKL